MLTTSCTAELFSTLSGDSIHNTGRSFKGNLGLRAYQKIREIYYMATGAGVAGMWEMKSLPNGVRNAHSGAKGP